MPELDIVRFLVGTGLLARGTPATTTPLAGGWWNQVERVRAPGVDWVVKAYDDGARSTLFPILPEAEARALEVLSGLGVAPEPVAFCPRTPEAPAVLVYAFVPGRAWDGDVEAVASLLAGLHAVEATGFREVPADGAAIVQEGDALAQAVPGAEELRSLRPRAGAARPTRRVLLHTDAGPTNLIAGRDGVRLIDWQCPALGDACEDVYSFLSAPFQILSGREPLQRDERRAFLRSYGPDEQRLRELWPAFAYRMGAYCAARAHELRTSDPGGAARYRRALAACLDDLREGPS